MDGRRRRCRQPSVSSMQTTSCRTTPCWRLRRRHTQSAWSMQMRTPSASSPCWRLRRRHTQSAWSMQMRTPSASSMQTPPCRTTPCWRSRRTTPCWRSPRRHARSASSIRRVCVRVAQHQNKIGGAPAGSCSLSDLHVTALITSTFPHVPWRATARLAASSGSITSAKHVSSRSVASNTARVSETATSYTMVGYTYVYTSSYTGHRPGTCMYVYSYSGVLEYVY